MMICNAINTCLPRSKVDLLADATLRGDAPVAGDDAVHFVQVPIDLLQRQGKLDTALHGTLHEEHREERSRLVLQTAAISADLLFAGRFHRGRRILRTVVVVITTYTSKTLQLLLDHCWFFWHLF